MDGNAGTPGRDVTRLVNLSDAVVAIAATLLVLPLVDQIGEAPGATAGDLVREGGQQFGAFVLSFVVIGRFWLVHHSVFDGVRRMSPALFWLNTVWLIGIVFLPYPTELVGVVGARDTWVPVLYIGTLTVTTLAGLGMDVVIARSPRLRAPGAGGPADLAEGVATVLTMAVALVLALVVPGAGLWPLLLLFLTPLVARVLPGDRRSP